MMPSNKERKICDGWPQCPHCGYFINPNHCGELVQKTRQDVVNECCELVSLFELLKTNSIHKYDFDPYTLEELMGAVKKHFSGHKCMFGFGKPAKGYDDKLNDWVCECGKTRRVACRHSRLLEILQKLKPKKEAE